MRVVQVHKLMTWYKTISAQQQQSIIPPVVIENADTAPLPLLSANVGDGGQNTDLTSLEDFPLRTYRDVAVQVLGVLYQWKEDNPLIVRVWDGTVMKL
jgi:hypothetical protein